MHTYTLGLYQRQNKTTTKMTGISSSFDSEFSDGLEV